MAPREPVDIAVAALRAELARAEAAAEHAARTKATCDERVTRLRSAIAETEAALATRPAVQVVEGATDTPPEDNLVGLTSVPRRVKGKDLGREMGGFSERPALTVPDRVLELLAHHPGREMTAKDVASLSNLPPAAVQPALSKLAREGRVERPSRGRYSALRAAS